MKYLAFDTETGGLDPKESSLLTAYFAILDDNLNTIDSLSLKVKPDDGLFKANPEALAINKINLEEHDAAAVTYQEAGAQLAKLIAKHSSKYDKLTPIAHNIEFDLSFVYEHLLSKKLWENGVSYRKIDTAQIANFLKLAGLLDNKQQVNLGGLAETLGVQFFGDGAHSAQADVEVMIGVLGQFKKLVNNAPKFTTPAPIVNTDGVASSRFRKRTI
jgi:DNA polymerase III alpha subunit (gram-positive type)